MNLEPLPRIQSALHDKRIFVLPYNHADHAWVHPRDWHLRRYYAIFEQVLALLRRHPEFKFFFDSCSEFLLPCLRTYRREQPFIRRMFREGRLGLAGGHWANVRLPHIGDETSVRNMILGRRMLDGRLPGARMTTYANLDVAIGHSQTPQLIRLGGYERYLAWRPQAGLDRQGVPRAFVWRGLSGDQVRVARMSYGGWWHAPEFYRAACDLRNWTANYRDWESPRTDLAHAVQWAWKHYLQRPAQQRGLKTLAFFHGGDDLMTFCDAVTGVERDLARLVRDWTAAGFGRMTFGTPDDFFDALAREKRTLPVWRGLLDPAEVGYNAAWHGRKGVWWLRELGERELLLAEQLATRASLSGVAYPAGELTRAWQRLLTYCTHAIEFLFDEDFAGARRTLESAIDTARQVQQRSLAALTGRSDTAIPTGFTIFNPLPESRREVVRLWIPKIKSGRLRPVLRDSHGRELAMQFLYGDTYACDYEVLVDAEFAAGGGTRINLEWKRAEVETPPPSTPKGLDARIESDVLKLTFRRGALVRVENQVSGRKLTSQGTAALLEPMLLPQKLAEWMPISYADNPLPFKVTRLVVEEAGPLRHRIARYGESGGCPIRQDFELHRGSSEVVVHTTVDLCRQSTNVVLGMPLSPSARLTVDIPFGVEERDLRRIRYGSAGRVDWNDIERVIPGMFWGRSWVFAKDGPRSFGLISVDGSRMYRQHGRPRRLLHMLACVFADQRTGWFRYVNPGRALGRHEFQHRLVLAGDNWRAAEMAARAQRVRTALPVATGGVTAVPSSFRVEPGTVRLSALCREGSAVLCRLVNLSDQPTEATIHPPFRFRSAAAVDFLGRSVQARIVRKGDALRVALAPWRILTLRFTGVRSDPTA